jgi:broad specificity phosphatase PhoE
MSTLTILIIRHAEKPGEAWPGPGLTPDGVADKKSLVIRGWQRAGAWSALFGAGLGGDDFPQPGAIYAANPSSTAGEDPSQRPFETIAPLAARLTLTPIVKYPLGAEHDLVAEIVGLT